MRFGRPSIEERQAQRAAERAANLAALCRPPVGEQRGTYTSAPASGPMPKEGAIQHQGYMAIVRRLPCMRCGYRPPVGSNQFCHGDQGKAMGLKTDVREGWAGCGPHDGLPGCHWLVGTSGKLGKQERRAEEDRLAALTRAEVQRLGLWPRRLPVWHEKSAPAPIGRVPAAMNSGAIA